MGSDLLVGNKTFYKFQSTFLTVFKWITILTVVLFLFGVIENKPKMFLEFTFVIKLFLAFFLIYRFNKYRKDKDNLKFTDLDRRICYSAGIYIVIISFVDYITALSENIRGILSKWSKKILGKPLNEFLPKPFWKKDEKG
jgi:hypothetical protein